MLRPQSCNWFELLTTREQLAPLLEALARSGAVELQTHDHHGAPLVVSGAQPLLERFAALSREFRAAWPEPGLGAVAPVADPLAALQQRLAQLEAWRLAAEPLIAERERLHAEQTLLADWLRLAALGGQARPDLSLLAATPDDATVGLRVYGLRPRSPALLQATGDVLVLPLPAGEQDYAVAVGREPDLRALDETVASHKGRRLAWPAGWTGDAAALEHRLTDLREREHRLVEQLSALATQHELAAALADIERLAWLIGHAGELQASERLVWVTGWTPLAEAESLTDPLARAGLQAVARVRAPPPGLQPPSLLVNPRWLRGFETFARMLGQPGRDEADPSLLLALIVPLLFGFMFGDVGQGAVLVAAGLVLRRRVPALALLIPGGVMAIVFGLLFGSVFAREDLIPALWLHPLSHPIELLVAAVALGVAILASGLLLQAVQAAWRHAAADWWRREAGLALAYAGALAALWRPEAAWAIAAGALWCAVGSAAAAERGHRGAALLAGAAGFVEHVLQLAVNTVSFARVGAFALAHAGLSAAVVGLAAAAGTIGGAIVMLFGNVLILVLEGMVVGIQTTRLVLFEFFVRFLSGTGRAFRPLAPPLEPARTQPTT